MSGHDGRDVATPGGWRLLSGDRRRVRATPVAPVDEATVDAVALARQAYAAEMLLQRALILVDEMLPLARTRAHQNDLLDLQNMLTGKAK